MKPQIQAPKEGLKQSFLALKTVRDLANLLEINYSTLIYHIYKIPPENRYETFTIPKKSGQSRKISAPITNLKIIQKKINYILHQVYSPKPSVHGFVLNRNIVTNAELHCKKEFVFNVDLIDFFPSINFGRVRGLFINPPYHLPPDVSTVLAQICCHENTLPQGAPTSPIISNMICSRMDGELQRLAGKYRCTYSRYADDITFSTFNKVFPNQLCSSVKLSSGKRTDTAGTELRIIIERNGFNINTDKVRLQHSTCRQSVTGLITNQFANTKKKLIKQIRSMLYDWDRYGLKNAQNKLSTVYKNSSPFKNVLRGKIEFLGMVRGKNDALYQRYLAAFNSLDPDFKPPEPGEALVSMNYSAFISHASEDKQGFVEPLVKLLQKAGFKIWYDKFTITDGDNIPLSINQGIAESNYAIIVFSKSYFRKAWPKAELAAFTHKDMGTGKKTIIPVWFKITQEDMRINAPLWCPLKAQSFPESTIKQIANHLAKKLKQKVPL